LEKREYSLKKGSLKKDKMDWLDQGPWTKWKRGSIPPIEPPYLSPLWGTIGPIQRPRNSTDWKGFPPTRKLFWGNHLSPHLRPTDGVIPKWGNCTKSQNLTKFSTDSGGFKPSLSPKM